MKLFKVSQNINDNWDTYDAIIVCADNEQEARDMHPYYNHEDGYYKDGGWDKETDPDCPNLDNGCWVHWENRDKLAVEYIGESAPVIQKGVILASFNAG
jgi:hypothetical protein